MQCDLEQIIRKHGDMVLRLAVAHVGNKIDAEDIYQEVFVRLVNSIDKINDEDHLRFWLIRVTINRSKSFHTSTYRKREVLVDEHYLSADEPEPVQMDTPATDALQELPEKYRTPLHLFYIEDLSISAIAKALDTSEGAVKTQLSRGRKMLGEVLQNAAYV